MKKKNCECMVLVNAKLAEHNGALEFNLFSDPPRALVRTFKKSPRGKKTPTLEATFCPFCGSEYVERKSSLAGCAK